MSQPKAKKTSCEDCGAVFEFTPHGFGHKGMVYIQVPKRCAACEKAYYRRYHKQRNKRLLNTRTSKLW